MADKSSGEIANFSTEVKCPTCKKVIGYVTNPAQSYIQAITLMQAHFKKKSDCRPKK